MSMHIHYELYLAVIWYFKIMYYIHSITSIHELPLCFNRSEYLTISGILTDYERVGYLWR